VACSRLISVSDCGLLSLNFSFELVACYHAVLPVVLNCKMHSLDMYKRQVVQYRFFGAWTT
jgi:hypothetical protein